MGILWMHLKTFEKSLTTKGEVSRCRKKWGGTLRLWNGFVFHVLDMFEIKYCILMVKVHIVHKKWTIRSEADKKLSKSLQ